MPSIIVGESAYKGRDFTFKEKYDYTYPKGLNLQPNSKLHRKIKDEILDRAYSSARIISTRHGQWRDIDSTLTAYIPIDDAERVVKGNDFRKPVSIVFPYSYTVMETLLSFYITSFGQEPVFRYEGVGPNDIIGAILLEKLISLQCLKNKVLLNLHTQARDAFAYGFGVVTPIWKTELGTKKVIQKTPGFMGFGSTEVEVLMKDQTLFEGNALENIDPYLYLPDPTVPIHDPQSGEYVGWVNPTNYMALLDEERTSNGEMFNVKYLKNLQNRRSTIFDSDNSGRNFKTKVTRQRFVDLNTNPVDRIKMFIRLIPKDWELGTSEYPELWYFELGSDEVVLKAKPAGLNHNKFPVGVIAPDYDGYSMAPVSRIEMLTGMQGVLDFLFNSHVANVRKAVNDLIIFDPYLVNSNDLSNPEPGKLVRLRRPAWGRGVKDVAMQLGITDVTRQNVADSSWIVQWMDRISGADSSMQGALRTGGPERLTGAEFQGTRAGGVNRLERIAKITGMQGMQDIGMFFASHAQQMMTIPNYIKLAGDWQELLIQEYGQPDRGRIRINPQDININYNVLIRDGSVPGGNYSDAWVQLFQILGQNPELAKHFDVVRIFTHIARNLGAKDVNDFIIKSANVQTMNMPNEQVQGQVQQGNLVPFPQDRDQMEQAGGQYNA